MKKTYITILISFVSLVLVACKSDQSSNIIPNSSTDNENETSKDTKEGEVMDEEKDIEKDIENSIEKDIDKEDEYSDMNNDYPEPTLIPEQISTDNPKIIVKKSDRILELWDGDDLMATYPIGLGWDPIGDKQKEGDGKTPEGVYYVCTRNNYSRFYLSLGLSYPNKEDAYEALEEGLINQSTYNQIEDAINNEVQPPWYTPLGGEIMIHGHGSHSDWTAGCVAVNDDIMDILWDNCPLGTQVIIEP